MASDTPKSNSFRATTGFPEGKSPRPRGGGARAKGSTLLRFIYDHSVSIVMLSLFALSLIAQSITGYWEQPPGAHMTLIAYGQYLVSSDFLETVAENWEGDFLPLTAYVFFTSLLHERGAKESRNPDERGDEPSEKEPTPAEAKNLFGNYGRMRAFYRARPRRAEEPGDEAQPSLGTE